MKLRFKLIKPQTHEIIYFKTYVIEKFQHYAQIYIAIAMNWTLGPALVGVGPLVLCKTCSVLLCEQPRVDNSNTGFGWEKLFQLKPTLPDIW